MEKHYILQKTDLTRAFSFSCAQKAENYKQNKMEDENNFLHRGESVAANLFYCSRAKV
jgi:hypothetical protein